MNGFNREREVVDAHEPKKCFVEAIFKDFILKMESKRKFVFVFDLAEGVPPSEPLGLEKGIHMCGGNILEFLDYHICDKECGEKTISLQHRTMLCKKINIKYDKNYRKMQRKTKKHKGRIGTLWATEMNFSKFRDRMLLIHLSYTFVIASQISGAHLRALGVASRYNLAVVTAELDKFL